jgi:hypothetical protein
MRKVWVTRPKENNSFGAVKARFGIHVQPDVCNTKQWMVASHMKTYHARFDTKWEAHVWLWKNFAAIVEEHDVIRKRRWVKKEV